MEYILISCDFISTEKNINYFQLVTLADRTYSDFTETQNGFQKSSICLPLTNMK